MPTKAKKQRLCFENAVCVLYQEVLVHRIVYVRALNYVWWHSRTNPSTARSVIMFSPISLHIF